MVSDPMAPLMFAVLFLLIFVGYPVAFVLGGVAVLFGALGVANGNWRSFRTACSE